MFVLAQEASGGDLLTTILPFVLLGAVFWFFIIRPQRNRQRSQTALMSSLEVGDRVRTIGGLMGRIRELDAESVVITVEDGSSLRFIRRAIAEKLTGD
jgi:preprotein translocase subunit YajC